MTHLLELLPVDPANPLAIIPALEEALTGQRTLLPVPANDPARTNLLRNTLKPGAPIDDDIALVVSTSGSTGKPKGAMLTPANLISSADATHQALGGEGQWLLAMPAAYIAGIQVLIRSMVAGVEPAFIDLTRGFNVAEFAARAHELAQTGERTYTALTPMQLAKATSTLKGIDALRTFSAVLVGGAATNPEQLFAAGYAACFGNAVIHATRNKETKISDNDVEVTATVGIGPGATGGFGLTVTLDVTLAGVDQAKAEEIVAEAHKVCPYSNATRGNVDVTLSTHTR